MFPAFCVTFHPIDVDAVIYLVLFKPRSSPTLLLNMHSKVMRWQPSIVLWGASAAGFVTLFMSGVPLFKKDVLLHVPVLREYFVGASPFLPSLLAWGRTQTLTARGSLYLLILRYLQTALPTATSHSRRLIDLFYFSSLQSTVLQATTMKRMGEILEHESYHIDASFHQLTLSIGHLLD